MLFTEGRDRVALLGLGGVGKTQIALELAHQVKQSMAQYSVIWMPAHSIAAFEKTATELVQRLGIPCDSSDDPKEALQSYLASDVAGHWLLILDNADDRNILDDSPDQLTSLSGFLPRSLNGRILITTRSSRVAVDAAGIDVVQLAEMTSDEAHTLLEKSLRDKSQLSQVDIVKELLKKLTYLPLTVAQAAAYMNVQGLPVTAYLQLCNSTDQNMINLLSAHLHDEAHYSKTQGAVATTWMISFNAICETDKVAARLLSFMQWIEPKAIPRTILPESDSDWSQTQAIGLLYEYGFINWREDGQTLDMHSLVHLALKFHPPHSHSEPMTQDDAIAHLSEVFPSSEWENRILWRQYFPHALPLVKTADAEASLYRNRLGYSVGRCLYEDGRIREATEVMQSVVSIREKTLAEDHPDRLASQHVLAISYRANGQVKQAISLLETVMAIRGETQAEDHPDRLASQHELAISYQANGRVKQAISLLETIVAIRGKTLAEDHPDRLASQHALAISYRANGQVKQAISLLETVVAIEGKTLAEDHPNRLASQHALASAYEDNHQAKQIRKHRFRWWKNNRHQ